MSKFNARGNDPLGHNYRDRQPFCRSLSFWALMVLCTERTRKHPLQLSYTRIVFLDLAKIFMSPAGGNSGARKAGESPHERDTASALR